MIGNMDESIDKDVDYSALKETATINVAVAKLMVSKWEEPVSPGESEVMQGGTGARSTAGL